MPRGFIGLCADLGVTPAAWVEKLTEIIEARPLEAAARPVSGLESKVLAVTC
jgi:hypothetical protein